MNEIILIVAKFRLGLINIYKVISIKTK